MIMPGQAQKEVAHNEALAMLDAIVGGAVDAVALNDPPSSPAAGSCYVVGAQPTGAWQGKAHHVAAYSAAGWRLIAPTIGLSLLVKQTGHLATYGTSGWEVGKVRASQLLIEGTQVVGPQVAAIAPPAGGATIDAEARSTIAQILTALRSHGLIAEV